MIIIQIRFQRRVDVSLHYVQSYENGFTAAAVNDFSARRNYFWRPLKTFAAAAVNRVQPSSLPSTTVLSPFKVRPLSLQRPSPPPSKSVLSPFNDHPLPLQSPSSPRACPGLLSLIIRN